MRAVFAVGASLALVALAAVGAMRAAGQSSGSSCPAVWSKTAGACGGGLVVIEKPFVVRTVEGTLADEGGRTWPGGVQVVLELAEVGRAARPRVTHAEVPSGKFKIKNTEPGEYCFRIGVRPFGWSCVEGRVVVSEAAPDAARVDVTVPLWK